MATMKRIEITTASLSGEDLEIEITDGPIRFVMPYAGTCETVDVIKIRELARDLNTWANWKNLQND